LELFLEFPEILHKIQMEFLEIIVEFPGIPMESSMEFHQENPTCGS
jgi:hypothetical protein